MLLHSLMYFYSFFVVFAFSNWSNAFTVYLSLNIATPNTKNAWIYNTDQLSSQPIRGIQIGNIPAKVVSIDCVHVIGLSINRELLLLAIT